jgi:TonB family protein
MHRALLFVFVLAASPPAIAQAPANVTAEAATQHLLTAPEAVYPPLAKTARIMGKVRLQFEIDESGVPTNVTLLSGHPMLVTSAMNAVRQYRYRPFEVAGKPVKVQTEVEISIPAKYDQKEVDRETEFQKAYWPNFNEGEAAYHHGELPEAESKLLKARAAAEAMKPEKWIELSHTITLLGHVALDRRDFATAEALYKEALQLRESHQKPDEAEVGGALGNLAILYMYMQKPDEAKMLLTRAATIYEARFATADPGILREARNGYGRSLALYSLFLHAIARRDGDAAEARNECDRAKKFASFAHDDEKQSIAQECGK